METIVIKVTAGSLEDLEMGVFMGCRFNSGVEYEGNTARVKYITEHGEAVQEFIDFGALEGWRCSLA